MSRLVSLDEHNAAIIASVPDPFLDTPKPNGIACPKCSKELVDSYPNRICAFEPVRKDVRCPKCGWFGTRLC